ncbi:MAG: hypothetical protein K8I29_04825 [Alphaproteobacteria bacterium]|uniref:Uncharacterized protein n=1 Tax=Candidatus Nitrobium versatile TaxID=2884831 RepID=A0A953LZF9_9BACT|nr:hypothetical protein [Candidatus Nitrobium versatile]
MFGKEIGMAVLNNVSSGMSVETGAEEIERELAVWQQIWDKGDQGGV